MDIFNFYFMTFSRNILCAIENQTKHQVFCWMGCIESDAHRTPTVAAVMGTGYEHTGQLWPRRYDRKRYHLGNHSLLFLVWHFQQKTHAHSCAVLHPFPLVKPQSIAGSLQRAVRWQPFFLSSKYILWLLLKSLCCNNPSNSTAQVIWSASSHFPESILPADASINLVLTKQCLAGQEVLDAFSVTFHTHKS